VSEIFILAAWSGPGRGGTRQCPSPNPCNPLVFRGKEFRGFLAACPPVEFRRALRVMPGLLVASPAIRLFQDAGACRVCPLQQSANTRPHGSEAGEHHLRGSVGTGPWASARSNRKRAMADFGSWWSSRTLCPLLLGYEQRDAGHIAAGPARMHAEQDHRQSRIEPVSPSTRCSPVQQIDPRIIKEAPYARPVHQAAGERCEDHRLRNRNAWLMPGSGMKHVKRLKSAW